MKDYRYAETVTFIFISLCVLSYSVGRLYDAGITWGYASYRPLYTLFTYPFFHVGFIHLLLNMLVFSGIYLPLALREGVCTTLAAGLCLSAMAGIISSGVKPVIGASGLNYVFLGWAFAIHVKENGRRASLQYGVLLFITLIAGFFHPAVQGRLHIVSCTGGFIFYYLKGLFIRHKKTVDSDKIQHE